VESIAEMAFDISEEQVAATEAELGRRLPPAYRSAMMVKNGCIAFSEEDEWDLHPIRDTSAPKRLSRSCDHVIAETRSAREWRGFPPEALAIGGNSAGDVMMLLPSVSDASRYGDGIFVFRHETGEVELLVEDFSVLEVE
jgi:hypothetical protein